jgi:hypothetical protein
VLGHQNILGKLDGAMGGEDEASSITDNIFLTTCLHITPCDTRLQTWARTHLGPILEMAKRAARAGPGPVKPGRKPGRAC